MTMMMLLLAALADATVHSLTLRPNDHQKLCLATRYVQLILTTRTMPGSSYSVRASMELRASNGPDLCCGLAGGRGVVVVGGASVEQCYGSDQISAPETRGTKVQLMSSSSINR